MEDVVKNYKWTTTQGSYLEEAPRVFATAYTTNTNQITEVVNSYFKLAGEAIGLDTIKSGVDYYNGLHKVDGKGEQFVFPYFNDDLRSLNNSWGDSYVGSTNGSNTGVDFLQNVKDLADTVINLTTQVNAIATKRPGALFEPPKFYQYAQDEGPVTVSFVLINTDNASDVSKNYNLVKKLINDNRFHRDDGNAFIVTPPKLWSVIIPGYRAIRWASCGVNVSMLGMRRYFDLEGSKKLVPEGYNVTLTFTPLYTEPDNFSSFYDQTGF